MWIFSANICNIVLLVVAGLAVVAGGLVAGLDAGLGVMGASLKFDKVQCIR